MSPNPEGGRHNDKSQGKVREFEKFTKRLIVNRVLKNIISINCKQFIVRNTSLLIFMF